MEHYKSDIEDQEYQIKIYQRFNLKPNRENVGLVSKSRKPQSFNKPVHNRTEGDTLAYPNKGIYYLGGICEGFETIAFFVICCLLPQYFPYLAYGFAGLCALSAALRVAFACQSFK